MNYHRDHNSLKVNGDFNHCHDLKHMHRVSIMEELQNSSSETTIFNIFSNKPAFLLVAAK